MNEQTLLNGVWKMSLLFYNGQFKTVLTFLKYKVLFLTMPCFNPLPFSRRPLKVKICSHSHAQVWSSFHQEVLPSPWGVSFPGVKNA